MVLCSLYEIGIIKCKTLGKKCLHLLELCTGDVEFMPRRKKYPWGSLKNWVTEALEEKWNQISQNKVETSKTSHKSCLVWETNCFRTRTDLTRCSESFFAWRIICSTWECQTFVCPDFVVLLFSLWFAWLQFSTRTPNNFHVYFALKGLCNHSFEEGGYNSGKSCVEEGNAAAKFYFVRLWKCHKTLLLFLQTRDQGVVVVVSSLVNVAANLLPSRTFLCRQSYIVVCNKSCVSWKVWTLGWTSILNTSLINLHHVYDL